ncbi:small subunit ribosomal protein S6e, partial [Schistosoma bovis]
VLFQLNIAFPSNGTQKCIEVDEELKLRPFYDKRMSHELPVDFLGDEWKGSSCYRPRRKGERRRKSVRGCIVDSNLSVLNLVVVRKGENDIPGLTDVSIPRRLGPKRASKIRKLFNLSKKDNVCQFVVRKPVPAKEGKKERSKAPKIQRLTTPLRLQRRRRRHALKRQRIETRRKTQEEYAKLLAQRRKQARDERAERKRSRSHSLRESKGQTDKSAS